MMLDRDKIGFWTRIGAFALAAIFILSGILFGMSSNSSYNLFELLGNGQQGQAEQTTDPQQQIDQARQQLEENPEDPRAITRLAGLQLQNGQTQDAIEVLERGREVAPEDQTIALYLGQAHSQRAEALTDEAERNAEYRASGDAFAAATEIGEDEPQAYLLAGQAYDQAGEAGRAIQYWNGYLELEPEGETADQVRERISALLEGGGATTGAAENPPEQ